MYCHKCGAEVREDEMFCRSCGTELKKGASASELVGEYDKLKSCMNSCRCIRNIALKEEAPSCIDLKCFFTDFKYYHDMEDKPAVTVGNSLPMKIFNAVFFLMAALFAVVCIGLEIPNGFFSALFLALAAARFVLLFAGIKDRKAVSEYINKTLGCGIGISSAGFYVRTALNCIWIILALAGIGNALPEREYADTYAVTSETVSAAESTVLTTNITTVDTETDIVPAAVTENTTVTVTESTTEEPTADVSDNTDKLVLNDVELSSIIGMSESDVINHFGSEYEKPSDYYISYNVPDYNYKDGWMEFYFTEQGTVDSFYSDPSNIYYNGVSLNCELEKAVEILGDDYENLGGAGNSFAVVWNIDGYAVSVYFPIRLEDGIENFNATHVYVYIPYETYETDYYDYPYGYEDDYEDYYDYSDIGPSLPEGLTWVETPYSSVDEYGINSINGVIRNDSGSEIGFASIRFKIYDSSGYQLSVESDYISDLGAGSSWRFKVIILDSSAASYEFDEVKY